MRRRNVNNAPDACRARGIEQGPQGFDGDARAELLLARGFIGDAGGVDQDFRPGPIERACAGRIGEVKFAAGRFAAAEGNDTVPRPREGGSDARAGDPDRPGQRDAHRLTTRFRR